MWLKEAGSEATAHARSTMLRFSIRFSYITAQSSSDKDTANTHSRVGIRIVGKYKAKLESEAAGLHALNTNCQNGRVRATTLLGRSGRISLAVY